MEAPAKNAVQKTPYEPYDDVMALPDTAEILLLKTKKYQTSVSNGMNSSRRRPTIRVFDTVRIQTLWEPLFWSSFGCPARHVEPPQCIQRKAKGVWTDNPPPPYGRITHARQLRR